MNKMMRGARRSVPYRDTLVGIMVRLRGRQNAGMRPSKSMKRGCGGGRWGEEGRWKSWYMCVP
jgi:hypothetical protein